MFGGRFDADVGRASEEPGRGVANRPRRQHLVSSREPCGRTAPSSRVESSGSSGPATRFDAQDRRPGDDGVPMPLRAPWPTASPRRSPRTPAPVQVLSIGGVGVAAGGPFTGFSRNRPAILDHSDFRGPAVSDAAIARSRRPSRGKEAMRGDEGGRTNPIRRASLFAPNVLLQRVLGRVSSLRRGAVEPNRSRRAWAVR